MCDLAMCKKNREIVRLGLELRRAKRREDEARKAAAEREAYQEAQSAALIEEINASNEFARIEKKVSERQESRKRAQAEKRANTRKRKRRAAENWRKFILRTLILALIGETALVLCDVGAMPALAGLPFVLWSCISLVLNFLSFTNWSRKEYEREGVTV